MAEVRAKSILNKSKVFDFCLNPYTGCYFGCRYCYASLFMRRYSGHAEPWGEFVDIKINAPELLRTQMPRAKPGTIWVSSVCDAYQPAESRYQLTRKCLIEISRFNFPVFIQTKSDLVVRDLDVLSSINEVEIGFSLGTDEDRIGQLFEPRAPAISRRIKALEKIKSRRFKTFAFIGPILPQNPQRLIRLIAGLVGKIFIDRLNYPGQFMSFYCQHNLESYASETYFEEIKNSLIEECKTNRIDYELLF